VPKKPKKPPIDRKSVRTRLERAQTEVRPVCLRRWIPYGESLDGFVVGVGKRWVALAKLSGRADLDGWTFARLKDIQSVSINPDPECFDIRALKALDQWPLPSPPLLELDDLAQVVASAERAGSLLSVSDEFSRPDACWIGSVTSLDREALLLHEVDVRGDWMRTRPRAFDTADVTRIEAGGGYERVLHLVAGPRV